MCGRPAAVLSSNERGIALPFALLALLILTALTLAFIVMSQTEPVIATNQALTTEARALAESGVERVLWALSTGALSSFTGTAAAPYDGSAFMKLSTRGGALITVTSLGDSTYQVTSTGWSPSNTATGTQVPAHRTVMATVVNPAARALDAPCALCVKGEVQLGGTSTVDARSDTSCGTKYGTYSQDLTLIGANAKVYGSVDGNNTANQTTDYQQSQDTSTFSSFTFTNQDLDALKALAKQNGTYWKTPSGGTIKFDSSNKVKNGVVFIDTVSGNDPSSTSDTSDLAQLVINGNPFLGTGGDGIFQGWIIVNGSISISGNMKIHGLVYANEDLAYTGTGTGAITGLVIANNLHETSTSGVDSDTSGNSTIIYSCRFAKGSGTVPQSWFVQSGSYSEPSD